jgi:primosomal protein N'
MAPRKEFVCLDCDWIGSPEIEPEECPSCGSLHIEEIGGEFGPEPDDAG